MNAQVLVIAGPSGVGKSSIIKRLLELCPNAKLLVSATTRKMRPGEKDGANYHFLSHDEFKKHLEDGNIPEYRYTPETGNYYGTFLPDLEEKLKLGHLAIADVDIIGAKFLKENYGAITVFIMPPSKSALLDRIKKREDNMDDKELKERLEIANKEMEQDSKFYDYIVVNEENKLQEATEKVFEIIKLNQMPCKDS